MQGIQDLAGKTAVVTGGGSGIGRSMVTTFAQAGMNVVVADVEEPAMAETVEALASAGIDTDNALTIRCDVSKADQVEALAQATNDRFGATHVLCNNAGVGGGGLMDECSLETWEWVLGVNLWGVIHGIKTFLPDMLERNVGHIINTASIAGHTSFPSMGPYNVSKHAVVTMSETLLAEIQQREAALGVSVLCPGFVATNILDSERNRPEQLMDSNTEDPSDEAATERAAMRAMALDLYEGQLHPDNVAGMVLDAVRNGEFYIFTDNKFDAEVAQRHNNIQSRQVPKPQGQLWERLL